MYTETKWDDCEAQAAAYVKEAARLERAALDVLDGRARIVVQYVSGDGDDLIIRRGTAMLCRDLAEVARICYQQAIRVAPDGRAAEVARFSLLVCPKEESEE